MGVVQIRPSNYSGNEAPLDCNLFFSYQKAFFICVEFDKRNIVLYKSNVLFLKHTLQWRGRKNF